MEGLIPIVLALREAEAGGLCIQYQPDMVSPYQKYKRQNEKMSAVRGLLYTLKFRSSLISELLAIKTNIEKL